MVKISYLTKVIALCFYLFSITAFSQSVSGKVQDASGEAIPYANVIEKGTTNGTTTDESGEFTLKLRKSPSIIVISLVGYGTVEKSVSSGSAVNIVLKEQSDLLEEVVLTGNRAKPRTILDSAVPIDNIGLAELQTTGQPSIDQALTYTVPSYNSSNQTVSDATAHFDPADLRGLGPSRTLVLVNGKRKNQSALVYVNDTPGKGEVGTDMKSIPTAAIERVEVLRDGASAQYGSDAVAGVVNIILKKNIDFTQVNAYSGVTKVGDGLNYGADVNHTFSIGESGFVNATLSGYHQDYTDRAGEPGKDDLFGVDNQWTRDNPDLGMIIGQPEMTKGDLFINGEYDLNDDVKLYAFGGFDYRKGKSFALYRTPYWITDDFGLLTPPGETYDGFQPTFETDIQDVLFTAGGKFKLGDFNTDLSATYGGNSVDYTIGNTINVDLGANSPTTFDAGAYAFSNIIGNLDINRQFGEDVSVGFGVEARQERFEVTAGEEASYFGSGAQSFPGLQPSNALNKTRTNIGAYGTLDWDINEDFLIGGAVRYENYSDFGGNTTWKVNSRYKIGEAGVLRGSYSTGFRAPSLHQVYLSNVQTLVSGGTISNQGTFNNVSPVIRDLGVEPLFAETSENISAGLTIKASRNFTISLDYYNVRVNDRVLFTGEIGGTDDNGNPNAAVQQILDANQVTSIKFFINAVNTITQGFDYTMRYKNIEIGSGKFGFNLALNINKTELQGEVKTPSSLVNYKNNIFNRKEQSRIISARPNTKFLFGGTYEIGKFNAALNNTFFGEVTWQHATDPYKDQTFTGKVVTDVSFGYEFSDFVSLNVTVNNLFDVFPDEIDTRGDVVTDLGGRFRYPWEVNQFGFNGMTFRGGLTFKF
jgi:iron complex outermembrane receptor protein